MPTTTTVTGEEQFSSFAVQQPPLTTLAIGEEGPTTTVYGEEGATTPAVGEESGRTTIAGEQVQAPRPVVDHGTACLRRVGAGGRRRPSAASRGVGAPGPGRRRRHRSQSGGPAGLSAEPGRGARSAPGRRRHPPAPHLGPRRRRAADRRRGAPAGRAVHPQRRVHGARGPPPRALPPGRGLVHHPLRLGRRPSGGAAAQPGERLPRHQQAAGAPPRPPVGVRRPPDAGQQRSRVAHPGSSTGTS